ncbi:MAG: hypothetical protein M5U34_08490 [Chloroflexi bacterium]|nr:hypothetical protein [Chloroflexota bacterium]
MPGSVQDIIAARLDRLPPDNKRITQYAAIIGRTFWQELLSHITDADSVEPTLSLLAVRQLADRLSQSQIAEDWEWMFRHILIQEVAYTTVPKTSRRAVHKQVAEQLEQELDEQTSFLLPLIGFHFEQGDVPDRAVYYLRQAGEQAASQFANEAAVGYFSRALAILAAQAQEAALTPEQQRQQYQLLLGRAEVYHLTGQRSRRRLTWRACKSWRINRAASDSWRKWRSSLPLTTRRSVISQRPLPMPKRPLSTPTTPKICK